MIELAQGDCEAALRRLDGLHADLGLQAPASLRADGSRERELLRSLLGVDD